MHAVTPVPKCLDPVETFTFEMCPSDGLRNTGWCVRRDLKDRFY